MAKRAHARQELLNLLRSCADIGLQDAYAANVCCGLRPRTEHPAAEGRRTGFRGFGRVGTGTDPDARYWFRTVKPAASAPDEAPRIDMIVLMRGILVHAFTRVYFSDEAAANAKDPTLALVPAERRDTLIAQRSEQGGQVVYTFDIHMQGAKETVFFDV